MENRTLFQLTADMTAIEDALWENGGELTPELEQALTETQESLVAKTDSYGALIRKFDAATVSIDAEIKRLQALKKTASNAVERLKERVLYSMENNGITKLDGTYTKFSLRNSTRTVVNEESMLAPSLFSLEAFRSTLPPYITLGDLKVNKTIIKDLYKKEGLLPADVAFEQNVSLMMR